MEEQNKLLFGFSEKQLQFERKYTPLAHGLINIKIACDTVIFHTPIDDLPHRVLNFLAYQIFEDFREIFILSANGLANGARKILRGMFERFVYLHYLEGHRDQVDLYLNYFWIDRFNRAERLQSETPNLLTPEQRKELDKRYNEVKEQYQIPVCRYCKIANCEDCKRTRINNSWSKMDLVSMAKKVGTPSRLLEIAYYIPMEETHPKIGAILRRISSDGETYGYDDSPRTDDERTPLWAAHYFLLKSLEVLKNNLQMIVLEEPLKQCWEDYNQTWHPYGMTNTSGES